MIELRADQVDIFSFGVLMWACFSRQKPFERIVIKDKLNLWRLRDRIIRGLRPEHLSWDDKIKKPGDSRFFDATNKQETAPAPLKRSTKSVNDEDDEIPDEDKVFELMRECWQMEPNKRPNFDDIVSRLMNALAKAKSEAELDEKMSKKLRASVVSTRKAYEEAQKKLEMAEAKHLKSLLYEAGDKSVRKISARDVEETDLYEPGEVVSKTELFDAGDKTVAKALEKQGREVVWDLAELHKREDERVTKDSEGKVVWKQKKIGAAGEVIQPVVWVSPDGGEKNPGIAGGGVVNPVAAELLHEAVVV